MILPSPLACTGLAIAGVLYFWQRRHRPPRRLPLPPGPKGLPLIGNLYDIPGSFEWERYARWGEEYSSDIISLNVAGNSIIVANSLKVATDLLEKRSSIYSSRPESTMTKTLVKLDWLFGFMKYGDRWKERRRMFQQHFHPLNTECHQPQELKYTHKLLKRLHTSPEDFADHIRRAIGEMAIAFTYGLDISPSDDRYIEIAENGVVAVASSVAPGAFLVDAIPILQYVPSWFPGAEFKRKARMWRRWTTAMVEVPFYDAERAVAAGTANMASFVPACLKNLEIAQDAKAERRVIMDTAGNVFVGGADTTVASVTTFILQMTLCPDIQAKAHAELDRVVGNNTLPSFADEPSLPYIGAIVKEVLRWHATTPLGVPHLVTEDDEYAGYFIPKNSLVVQNAWAMLHDKRDYDEPFSFRPERFLTPDGSQLDTTIQDPDAAFGLGRRICPGRHIATSMLYIAIASILSVFEISKARDENGELITPSGDYVSNLISHPLPFRCAIKPRSKEAEGVIADL